MYVCVSLSSFIDTGGCPVLSYDISFEMEEISGE